MKKPASSANPSAGALPARRIGGGFDKYKKTLILLTMVLPVSIWLIVRCYMPMAGLVIAFKDYKVFPGIQPSGAA